MKATKEVSELEGAELDYWVAKADGQEILAKHYELTGVMGDVFDGVFSVRYSPSTDWRQGGPIIEREGIAMWANNIAWIALHPAFAETAYYSNGTIDASSADGYTGSTPLIAAMRCFVASKFGEVPKRACAAR